MAQGPRPRLTPDIQTTMRGLLSAPQGTGLLSASPSAPAPVPRGRVNGFRVALGALLGNGDPFESLDTERARLETEALRPQMQARQARIQSYVDTLPVEFQLAFANSPDKLAEAFASRAEGRVLDPGDVYMSGERPTYGAAFDAAPGSSVFNPLDPSTPLAVAAQENKVAGGALVTPDGRVLYRGPQVEGVPATADAFYTPEIAQGAGGGVPRAVRQARPDFVSTPQGGATNVFGPNGELMNTVQGSPERRRSYEDANGVRRFEDTSEPVFPADETRVRSQARNRLDAATTATDNLVGEIDKALALTGSGETGLVGSVMGAVPGTRAQALRATIETIKANIGFNYLQQMRELSPTGGALGQVAVQEMQALQSVLANLDPNLSEAQLETNLNQAKAIITQGRALRERTYLEQFGSAPATHAPVTVRTPAEAQALPPGTRYRNPSGQEFVR